MLSGQDDKKLKKDESSGSASVEVDLSPEAAAEKISQLYAQATYHIQEQKKGLGDYVRIPSDYPEVERYIKVVGTRVHEIRVDTRYDVTTYVLHGNKEDRKAGLTGTDETAVVKVFGKRSYDYIKVDDYIDRDNSLFAGVLRVVDEQIKDSKTRIEFKRLIAEYKDKVRQEILEKVSFNGLESHVRDSHIHDKEANEALSKKHAEGVRILKQTLANLAASITQTTRESLTIDQVKIDLDESVKLIKQAEIDLTRERGRPFVIKVGAIKDQDKMISAQFPLGNMTIPSTDRSGEHEKKLSNHVRDITAKVVSSASGQPQVEILGIVDGHSSPPPIGIEEKDPDKASIQRRYVAYQAIKEELRQHAIDLMLANPTAAPGSLTFTESFMMMLTPLIGEIESSLRAASEHEQLADTKFALDMISHLDDPMTITLDSGRTEKINLKLFCMNFPVNAGKKSQIMTSDPLQSALNSEGFYDFSTAMKNDAVKLLNMEGHEDVLEEIADLNSYYDNPRLEHELQGIVKDIKNIEENYQFQEQFKILKHLMEEIEKNPENKELIKNYKIAEKYIEDGQEKIIKLYLEMEKINKHHYMAHRSKNKKLQTSLSDSLSKSAVISNPKLSNKILAHLRFLKAEDIFYREKYLKKSYAYQFHVLYLLANEAVGRKIDAFCKSAEDRTGWLRICMLANHAFFASTGRLPDFSNKEDRELFNEFSAAALELSASIENTKYNSEARSIQVRGDFTNPDFNIQAGKDVSLIAKVIFKDLPKAQYIFSPETVTLQKARSLPGPLSKVSQKGFFGMKKTQSQQLATKSALTTKTFRVPHVVDRKDLKKDDVLLEPEWVAKIKNAIQGIDQSIRLSKRALKMLGVDNSPYSVMVVPREDGAPRVFAIYKGKKQNKHVAEGGLGMVKALQDIESNEFFALKLQALKTDYQKDSQKREEEVLKKAGALAGSVIYSREVKDSKGGTQVEVMSAMIMDYAYGKQPTAERVQSMDQKEAMRLIDSEFKQITDLHAQGVFHNDIKPGNIHYDMSDGKSKLVDFGTALVMDPNKKSVSTDILGTPVFMEPRLRHMVREIDMLDTQIKSNRKLLSSSQITTQKKRQLIASIQDLEARKQKIQDSPKVYTASDDVHSFGTTIGVQLGMAEQYIAKPDEADLSHYRISTDLEFLAKNSIIKDDVIRQDIVNVLLKMTDPNPAKRMPLDEASQAFARIEAKLLRHEKESKKEATERSKITIGTRGPQQ